jgi:hypothetical protein
MKVSGYHRFHFWGGLHLFFHHLLLLHCPFLALGLRWLRRLRWLLIFVHSAIVIVSIVMLTHV